MQEPSGLQTGMPAPSDSVVSCSGSPPSAGMSQICGGPSAARRNASVVPSGDQAGDESAGPFVSRRASPPVTPTDQIERRERSSSPFSSRRTYTHQVASGERAGCSGTASAVKSSMPMRRLIGRQPSRDGEPFASFRRPKTCRANRCGRRPTRSSSEQILHESGHQRRALGKLVDLDVLAFGVRMVADGAEAVEHLQAEPGEHAAV